MEDTDRKVRAIQQRIWMSLPEEERFRKCGEMFELAKAFALKRAPAGLSKSELAKFVLREFYGADVTKNEL